MFTIIELLQFVENLEIVSVILTRCRFADGTTVVR
jgi:hypothetical protein